MFDGKPGSGKTTLAQLMISDAIKNNLKVAFVSDSPMRKEMVLDETPYWQSNNTKIDDIRFNDLRLNLSFFNEESYDLIVVDNAQRTLGKKPNKIENDPTVKIIRSSQVCVFFIDEKQKLAISEEGSIERITKCASFEGADINIEKINDCHRFNDSDEYVGWVESILGYDDSDYSGEKFNFDARIYHNPNEMLSDLKQLSEEGCKTGIAAGPCWSHSLNNKYEIELPKKDVEIGDFEMDLCAGQDILWSFNNKTLDTLGTTKKCINAEFDYLGVIIGEDIGFNGTGIFVDRKKRSKNDSSLRGLNNLPIDIEKSNEPIDPQQIKENIAATIIKNTYRMFMTRSMQGSFFYCVDTALSKHIEESIRTNCMINYSNFKELYSVAFNSRKPSRMTFQSLAIASEYMKNQLDPHLQKEKLRTQYPDYEFINELYRGNYNPNQYEKTLNECKIAMNFFFEKYFGLKEYLYKTIGGNLS